MQTMKLKSAKTQWYGRAGFGLTPPTYVSMARFCNSAEALFGLKTVAIGRGRFGSGSKLTLSGGNNRKFELLVSNGRMLLGELKNDGTRIRLAEGADTKADWNRLLQALEKSERRLSV